MINRSEWFLEVGRAIFADRYQPLCEAYTFGTPDSFQALPNGLGHRRGHALSRELGQLFDQSVRLFILIFSPTVAPLYRIPATVLPDVAV
jgi:hypothetical protein